MTTLSKPPYLEYVKIPDEAIAILVDLDRPKIEKLSGAIVLHMLSGGERQTVTKGIKLHYQALIPALDRILRGAKNRYKGRRGDLEACEDLPESAQESTNIEQEMEQNTTAYYDENIDGFESDSTVPFDYLPADSLDLVDNQTDELVSYQTDELVNNQRYESESGSESEGGYRGSKSIDEDTRLKLVTLTNKLTALHRMESDDAKRYVWESYCEGGIERIDDLDEELRLQCSGRQMYSHDQQEGN